MKCERCGNPTKWVGSLMSGHLECEHCANDDACLRGGVEFAECSVPEPPSGNPLTCGKGCSMNGGADYCQCYGEPSILKDMSMPKAPSSVFGDWDEYQKAMEIYMKNATVKFRTQLKGEFK